MPGETSVIEEISRIADGLVSALADVCACKALLLLPSQVGTAATAAGTRLCLCYSTYKLHTNYTNIAGALN